MSINKRATIRTPRAYTLQSIKNAYDDFTRRLGILSALDRAYFTGQGRTAQKYTVNYCKYIADTKTAYIAGLPPVYQCADDDPYGAEMVDYFKTADMAVLDQELVSDCSRYGRAFEIAYMDYDETGTSIIAPRSASVSPLDAFVAYDESLDPEPVFGCVHYTERLDTKQVVDYLDVYDDREVVRYRVNGPTDAYAWTEIEGTRREHGFGHVPLVEFRNNPDCIADFESILDLQDAINEVLSDRIKDKTRFASASLVAKGLSFGDSDEEVDEMISTIKEQEYISIPRDADLSYLVKTLDESSVQVLMDDLVGSLHKISMIPDMSDDAFAGNASGVAMRYKLLGLNNLAQSLVSEFNRSFRRRCELYDDALNPTRGVDLDGMRVVFTFNTPDDLSTSAQVLQTLVNAGIISRRTAMANCTYVDDVEAELERIEEEEDADPFQDRLRDSMDDDDEDDYEQATETYTAEPEEEEEGE